MEANQQRVGSQPEGRWQAVRFQVSAVRLPLTEAVAVGELVRRSAMARYGRLHAGNASPLLSGKDAQGRFLIGHDHTHYLPTDEDGDGHIDHLTLWTPAGLGPAELGAVVGMTDLVGSGLPPIGVSHLQHGDRTVLPSCFRGPARHWVSTTPYVLTRHPKLPKGPTKPGRMTDQPADQVERDLSRRGLASELVGLETLAGLQVHDGVLRWADFKRSRAAHPPAVNYGLGYRLRFAREVEGPIALGYASHYGLGLFLAEG